MLFGEVLDEEGRELLGIVVSIEQCQNGQVRHVGGAIAVEAHFGQRREAVPKGFEDLND